ncbi:MAG: hypothetical protein V7L29_19855 [Nostoc sp.]|uniref:hypothetical protein n=1 Tax=Nostoc sp. TaxID=1180 RepID=UPI002FF8189A
MAKLTNHQPASHVLVAVWGEFLSAAGDTLIYCSLIHPPNLEFQCLPFLSGSTGMSKAATNGSKTIAVSQGN